LTEAFSKRLLVELNKIKADLKKKRNGSKVKIALELERRMSQMEYEHRMEEEKSRRGKEVDTMNNNNNIVDEATTTKQQSEGNSKKKRKKIGLTKSTIKKEMVLRERSLEGRSRSSSELLVLPYSLKKKMVEEWEIITQCNMYATLPANVTIKDALEQYLEYKMESLTSTNSMTNNDKTQYKVGKEWREMVDGICLFFDQAVPERLLYSTEIIQYNAMQEAQNIDKRSPSEIYGCEYLLRMFLRLPALLVGELPEKQAKSILLKLNDLLRYLQKHETQFFTQSYHRKTVAIGGGNKMNE